MNKKLLITIVLVVLVSAFLVSSQSHSQANIEDNAWLLRGDRRVLLGDDYFGGQSDHGIVAIVIIPEPVSADVITAAWSYAVRYGADGIDLPNYERSVEIMMERHPTWIASTLKGYTVGFTSGKADLDIPDPLPEATSESTPSN